MLPVPTLFGLVRDFAQTVFFVTVGIITVLTYLRARATFFQPFRMEVFKEQLKVLGEALRSFQGKNEVELRNDLGLDRALYVNAVAMLDDYACTCLGATIASEDRPYSPKVCPTSLVSEEYLRLADDHLVTAATETASAKEAPTQTWAEYRHAVLYIPRQLSEGLDGYTRLSQSPFLPTECAQLLSDYIRLTERNIRRIQEVLIQCAPELPQKYPDKEILARASFDWIQNRYAEGFEHLRPKASAIVAYARQHLAVDKIACDDNAPGAPRRRR